MTDKPAKPLTDLTPEELQLEIEKEAENVFRHTAIDFLTKNVPEYDISQTYALENPKVDPLTLAEGLAIKTPLQITLRPVLDPKTGEITDYEEVFQSESVQEGDSKTSMSLRRAPDPKALDNVRGSSSNIPFMPGGFDDEIDQILRFSDWKETKQEEEIKFLNFEETLNQPPGYSKPITFSDEEANLQAATKTIQTVTTPTPKPEPMGSQPSMNGPPIPTIDLDNVDLFSIMDLVGTSTMPFETSKPEIMASDLLKKKKSTTSQVEPNVNVRDDAPLPEGEIEKLEEALKKQVLHSTEKASVQHKPPPASLFAPFEQANFTHCQVLDVTKTVPKYEEIKPIMAKKYPFELDPFQQQAVIAMEEGHSVFVAAHTSAGKTVVAEYAIALSQAHKSRVIYTSPIKALSNQKFRDFKMMFDEVGLITGDIQLNSDAFCLIMTTEILKSMLYNGSEVIRELEWVIFDEVHYINDADRGHVWEEVLIMLPSHIKIVMLSATVPNCVEFADWVGRIKNRKIQVIQTLYRPVPLEHNLYTGKDGKSKNDIFLIKDAKGDFLNFNYKKAEDAKKGYLEKAKEKAKKKGQILNVKPYQPNAQSDRNVYINLIDFLKNKDLLPMVVFVFSRKRCDENADVLQSVDLTEKNEKHAVRTFFSKCVDRLKGSDKDLPQVRRMQELCERGFAVHHSGILPILKEVVELLFAKGYVKVLFATETFAMGVNMPARTVVFDAIEKFDGTQRRLLNATEYVQMAGRAGRRGLDKTGTVIVLCKGNDVPGIVDLRSMLQGKAVPLESKFRVTYGMLLNLLRVEHLTIEQMLQRSYVERTSLRLVVDRKERIKQIDDEISAFPKLDCSTCYPSGQNSLANYHKLLRYYISDRRNIWIDLQKYGLEKLIPVGKVLIVTYPQLEICGLVAVVLKIRQVDSKIFLTLFTICDKRDQVDDSKKMTHFNGLTPNEQRWEVESLLMEHCAVYGLEGVTPLPTKGANIGYRILEDVPLDNLLSICKQQVKNVDTLAILEDHRKRMTNRRAQSPDRSITRLIVELESLTEKWSNDGTPASLFGIDIKKDEITIHQRLQQSMMMREELLDKQTFPCQYCVYFKEHLSQLRNRIRLEEAKEELVFSTSSSSLLLGKEYQDKLHVLRALNYIDTHNMVELKGKVACEIHHQELLVTELILDNKFSSRSNAEIAAMLSPLTTELSSKYKNEDVFTLTIQTEKAPQELINELKYDLLDVAKRIDDVQQSFGLPPTIVDELNFDLMEAVYQWSSGVPFSEIMELTTVQEGIIVRCIQRLDETCKDVRNAARIVGDPTLYEKMEEVSASIRRDIVFAASLYTTTDE